MHFIERSETLFFRSLMQNKNAPYMQAECLEMFGDASSVFIYTYGGKYSAALLKLCTADILTI